MQPILEIKHVSKKYKLGSSPSYLSLREVISNRVKTLTDLVGKRTANKTSSFWALDDVSLDVLPGKCIGIIGQNGAGKSTLLKILSRITPPTLGSIVCRGRIASLLEVGTGFHPELTGRENIFMNGSILGMKRAEIRQQFDQIVDFSGVARFLDTPLKQYSSGMQLRLAFAVAAHLEPEILIVDEVLAVGDAEFQKKCLGKMQEVTNTGRTVLFVSHDLTAVRSLTEECLLLELGKTKAYGPTDEIVATYLNQAGSGSTTLNIRGKNSSLASLRLINEHGHATNFYDIRLPLHLEITFAKNDFPDLSFELFLKDQSHRKIALASLSHFHDQSIPQSGGQYRCKLSLNPFPLASGAYYLDLAISQPKVGWDLYAENALKFEVLMSNPNSLSWDFKQEYNYGQLAWTTISDPEFTLIDAAHSAF